MGGGGGNDSRSALFCNVARNEDFLERPDFELLGILGSAAPLTGVGGRANVGAGRGGGGMDALFVGFPVGGDWCPRPDWNGRELLVLKELVLNADDPEKRFGDGKEALIDALAERGL